MNRFLKKKAPEPVNTSANDDAAAVISPVSRPSSPTSKKSSGSRWRRGKKQAQEEKPAVDMATILPTNDDFRTSLLMPNLSARFSMLREQDDPKSLLGKASDDSVLSPRRRSRLVDFGQSRPNLGDIAEVASIKSSSIRPPFATESRQHSFASEDGYASENDSTNTGSMMSRARPGEGNVLFGGRQKVYMIPKSGAASSKSLGRPVYDDDIGISPFQRYRRQREPSDERPSNESQPFDFGLDLDASAADVDFRPNDSGIGLSYSPSLSSFEKKRSTASTSRSEARSSFTAATSVNSHPNTAAASPAAPPTQPPAPTTTTSSLKRSDTKTRRMYEQGLDQHMYEQQTTALTRINSIQRQRTLNGRPVQGLHGTKSASNLHDRSSPPVFALRGQSPTPAAPLASFGSIRKPSSGKGSPSLSGPQSPAEGEFDDAEVLNQAMQPGDRGKATAMGAFNKPQQAFDEDQYLERQRQLQRSNSTAAVKKDAPAGLTSVQQRLNSFEEDRKQSESDASARTRSRSRPRQAPEMPNGSPRAFQKSATTPALSSSQAPKSSNERSAYPDTHRTFFGDISASESEDDESGDAMHSENGHGPNHGRWQPTILPSVSEHPALRGTNSKNSLAEADEEPAAKVESTKPAFPRLPPNVQKASQSEQFVADSPTVPNNVLPNTVPLNGFVHHLRQPSNQSSVYQPESNLADDDDVPEVPEWNPNGLDVINRHLNANDSDARSRASYATSNPWDLDDLSNSGGANGEANHLGRAGSPVKPIPRSADSPYVPTTDNDLNGESEVSQISESENDVAWLNGNIQHTRDASTETQQERNAFADELAARRHAIQQNIKSMVEQQDTTSSSRGSSPGRSATGGFKAMLRAKSSREQVSSENRREPVIDSGRPPQLSSKAMKTLGIAASNGNVGMANPPSLEAGSRSRQNSGSRNAAPVPRVPRAMHSTEQDFRRANDRSLSREESDMARNEQNQSRQHMRSPASSLASVGGARSRAGSEVTGNRSRSRTGPYREDLDKSTMMGETSLPAKGNMSPAKLRDGAGFPSPSLADADGNYQASNRAGGVAPSYFEKKGFQPQTLENERSPGVGANSPDPSSSGAFTYPAARPSASPSPVPGQGYAQNMTQPLSAPSPEPHAITSNSSTTLSNAGQTQPYVAGQRPPLRKKTISKHSISEPTLISATSNIDTVDLPEGASLRNGMDPPPPPIPPINPKRRGMKLFGLGSGPSRTESEDSMSNMSTPRDRTPLEGNFNVGNAGAGAASAMGYQPTHSPSSSATATAAAPLTNGVTHAGMEMPPVELPRADGMRDRSASSSPRPSGLGVTNGVAEQRLGGGGRVEVDGAMF